MNDYKIIDKCLLCNGMTKKIFSLGETPLANEFVDQKFIDSGKKQDLFPLNLIQCLECNHVQLDCIVNQDRLYRNYSYVTGTSSVNIKHFQDYAHEIIYEIYGKQGLFPDKNRIYDNGNEVGGNYDNAIIDIGSNDGTFLKNFVAHAFYIIGIDPARNLKEIAKKNGVHRVITEFFNYNTAKNIIKPKIKNKNVKVITCNNMFAHNENLHTIIDGVLELLDDDGIFVFENSYLLDMCEKTLLDLVYHEHIHHHHIGSLKQLFNKYDMDIYKVKRLNNHGGSVRVFTCKKSNNRLIDESVNECLEQEKNINEKLSNFEKNSILIKEKIIKDLAEIKQKIGIYGYPAKATTILYYLGLDPSIIEFVIDDNSLKQGKFTPGNHIPIFSKSALGKYNPNIILILAWNFAQSIMKNNPQFKGNWLVPEYGIS